MGEAGNLFATLGRANGQKVTPFSFVQLSEAHVGFKGPPDPLGTQVFERAVEMINSLPQGPDLVWFTLVLYIRHLPPKGSLGDLQIYGGEASPKANPGH